MIDEYETIQRDIADIFSRLNEKLSYTADSAAAMLDKAKSFAEKGAKDTSFGSTLSRSVRKVLERLLSARMRPKSISV